MDCSDYEESLNFMALEVDRFLKDGAVNSCGRRSKKFVSNAYLNLSLIYSK